MSITLVLPTLWLFLALVCFLIGAANINARINVVALGLFFCVLWALWR